MKNFVISLLKFIFWTMLILIVGLGTFGLVIWLQHPWWIGCFFILGYFGLFCIWLLVRKILLRRREKNFVNDVIAQDRSVQGASGESAAAHDLQSRWKQAIDTLQNSKLGRSGNPLYALPWYMVIGESHSGKTTAIRNAGLAAPFAETRSVSGIGGTRNCDWWFFEQAVILDTAGRYAIPLDEGRDRQEWQKFLSLLVKYRKREALNGLVVTVAADKLLRSGPQSIADDGQQIRQRMDELMRVLGMKVPVYVLVTKCDLIQGMTSFCERLPENSLQQVMGFMNRDMSGDVTTFLEQLGRSIQQKLRDLRLLLFSSERAGSVNSNSGAELLLFPNEFGVMEGNLRQFVESAFSENPYQETPMLRGIYFSSGKQEGNPYSSFLGALGLVKTQDVPPPVERSFFIYDLFADVMAKDRSLYSPTTKALSWQRLTRNIGLMAWAAIVLSICGLLSFSFVKNLTTLRTVADEFVDPVTLQGEVVTDTAIMERFQNGVAIIEDVNSSWWFPRLGLGESEEVEARIKEKYCARFSREFAIPFDKQLQRNAVTVTPMSPDDRIGDLVEHLTYRINLVQERLAGDALDDLASQNQPSFASLISSADSQLVAQLSDRVSTQYLHYLTWQADESRLVTELKELQKLLHHVLSQPDSSLNWLVGWANEKSGSDQLTLAHFWGPSLAHQSDIVVPPAFTRNGRRVIDDFIEAMEKALPDQLLLTANKTRFSSWYSRAYKQIWYDFARKFPQAEEDLEDKLAWQQAASTMALDTGPYFNLLSRMEKELANLDEKDEEWIHLLKLVGRSRLEAEGEKAIRENKSVIAKVAKKGKKALSKIEKGIGTESVGKLLETGLASGIFFNNYRDALSELVLATSSRDVSFSLASEVFTGDPAVSDTPMYKAQRSLIKLRNELSEPTAAKETMVIWKLVAGPLTFLRDYAYLEASCKLNTLWEEEVLVEVQDVKDKTRLNDQFFEKNGLAIEFVNTHAKPFLRRNLEQGFYPNRALGRMVPFRQEFLTFMTDGIRLAKYKPDLRIREEMPLAMKRKKERESAIPPEPVLKSRYAVVIQANPTGVNKGAKMIPHAVSLEMVCGAEVTRLMNLQYPVRQKFVWKPKECRELSLKIELGSLMLEKRWEDAHSFARFLDEYRSGSVTYTPLDFPEKQKYLKRLNVRTITVKFKAAEGGRPLLAFMEQLEARKKALGLDEEGKEKEPNVAEILMSLEDKRKAEELENEAMKKAWKSKQLARAAEIKRQWEARLPNVPRDITVCWD